MSKFHPYLSGKLMSMFVSMYLCMYACLCTYVYACVYLSMHVCVHTCVSTQWCANIGQNIFGFMFVGGWGEVFEIGHNFVTFVVFSCMQTANTSGLVVI